MLSHPDINSSRLNTAVFTRLKAIWRPCICPSTVTKLIYKILSQDIHSPSHQSLFVKSISPYNNRSTKPTQILAQRGGGGEGRKRERWRPQPALNLSGQKTRNQKQSTVGRVETQSVDAFHCAVHLIKSYVCQEDLRQSPAIVEGCLEYCHQRWRKTRRDETHSCFYYHCTFCSLLIIIWKMENSAGNIRRVRGKKEPFDNIIMKTDVDNYLWFLIQDLNKFQF